MSDEAEFAAFKASIDEKYAGYHKRPPTHPRYVTEWNNWWIKKDAELQSQGITKYNRHDHQHDWFKFWHDRVEQLKQMELDVHRMTSQKNAIKPVNILVRIENPISNYTNETLKRPRMKSPVALVAENDENNAKRCKYENVNLLSVFRLLSPIQEIIDAPFVPQFIDYFKKFAKARIFGKSDIEVLTDECAAFLTVIKESLIGRLVYKSLKLDNVNESENVRKVLKLRFALRNIEKLLEKHSFIKPRVMENDQVKIVAASRQVDHGEGVANEPATVENVEQNKEIVENVSGSITVDQIDVTTIQENVENREEIEILSDEIDENNNTNVEVVEERVPAQEVAEIIPVEAQKKIDSAVDYKKKLRSRKAEFKYYEDHLAKRTKKSPSFPISDSDEDVHDSQSGEIKLISMTNEEFFNYFKHYNDLKSDRQCALINFMINLKKTDSERFEIIKASIKKLKNWKIFKTFSSV